MLTFQGTTDCKVYTVKVDIDSIEKIFILVDTPGLHDRDSTAKNLMVLEKIAIALKKDIHNFELEITGAIFFHNITEGKLTGTIWSILDIFASMCGKKFSNSRVAFITTQWDALVSSKTVLDRLNGCHTDIGNALKQRYPKWRIFARRRNMAADCKEVLEHFSELARSGVQTPPFALLKEWQSTRGEIKETSVGKKILGRPGSSSSSSSLCSIL